MSNAVQQINKMKAGACPHGLPTGACPICSCSAGSMKQSDKNRKIGEMTYHECVMTGHAIRARKNAIKEHGLTGVVVCSCSPRMHEATFRKALAEGKAEEVKAAAEEAAEEFSVSDFSFPAFFDGITETTNERSKVPKQIVSS